MILSLHFFFQKTLLGEDENSRAYFEYTTLIGDSNTQEHDVEIFVGRGDSVNFMIKLNIDYSQLPALFSDEYVLYFTSMLTLIVLNRLKFQNYFSMKYEFIT